jgi:murein DD-endopeptidase MepM/ murein hydrolase activator NlpD
MQSIIDNHIVKLDSQRFFLPLIVFAFLSIFLHILLHNYDNIEEKNLVIDNYTSSFSTLPLDEKNTATPSFEAINNKLLPKTELVINNNIEEEQKKITKKDVKNAVADTKKLGNLTLLSVKKNTNLSEIVQAGSYQEATAISHALVKNKKNPSLKKGDMLHIVENKTNKKHNLKIVIQNKSVVTVKKFKKDYKISLSQQDDKKVPDIKSQVVKHSITYQDLLNKNHKIPQHIKLDLLKLHSLLKKTGVAAQKYQVAYSNSRFSKILTLDVYTGQGIKKIYKFKDRGGNMHFVESDGSLVIEPKVFINKFAMTYPIANPVIGSGFGMRKHPILGCHKMHKGMDFRARRGTPIYAPADGIIIDITHSKGFGKNIRIRHNNVYTTLYGHLDAFANKKVGHKIHRGDVIGFVGKTGLASGEHLHFELHENGRPINPMQAITPSKKISNNRLTGRDLQAFKSYTSQVEAQVKFL